MIKKITKTLAIFALVVTLATPLIWSTPASAQSEPFLGEIIMVGFNFAPRGWAFCDGQLLGVSDNTALFALLGTTYGGDGRTTFALPDMRGRVAIHPGNGPGLSSYLVGQKGGTETNVLTVDQIPSHTHTATAIATVKGSNSRATTDMPGGNTWGQKKKIYSSQAPDVDMHAGNVDVVVTIDPTGGSQPVNNIQPYIGINHCIALVGIFPTH